MSKQTRGAKSTATPGLNPKKSLKELFDDRDRTRPGSREEEQAAEKILESVFPDTDVPNHGPAEMRAYVSRSFVEMWQYSGGEQLFSRLELDGRDYLWMTSKSINLQRDGPVSSCKHDAGTRARYDLFLASKQSNDETGRTAMPTQFRP